MKIDEIKVGDTLAHWFDTGAMGADLVYSEVIKIGRKLVKVRCETGDMRWKRPEFFLKKVNQGGKP